MNIDYIRVGTNANDGTGDDLRTAFQRVNSNFQELDGRGGETNTGENIGSGSGLYVGKSNLALQFKSLVAGDGVTITPGTNIITISSTTASPNTISRIVGNTGHWDINQPNSVLQILGSEGSKATTRVSGNQIFIDSEFLLEDDTTPRLGGDVDLNEFDIVGTGNIAIVGNILADNLTIGRQVSGSNPGTVALHASLTVGGTTTLAGLSATSIVVSNGTISAGTITATTGLIGTLTGSVIGNLKGDVRSTFNNSTVLSTAGAEASFTGNVVGSLSGGFTGFVEGPVDLNDQAISGTGSVSIEGSYVDSITPLYVKSNFNVPSRDAELFPPLPGDGFTSPLFEVINLPDYGKNEALKIRSRQVNGTSATGIGAAILFDSVNEITDSGIPDLSPEYLYHGKVSMQAFSSLDYSDFVVTVRTNRSPNSSSDPFIVSGDQSVHASGITILGGVISNGTLNLDTGAADSLALDVVLTNNASGKYINFYNQYKLPKVIGSPGQVLSVPAPGSTADDQLLIWSDGGSGGNAILAIQGMLVGQSPIQVTTVDPHGLVDGTLVTITNTGVPEMDGVSYYANVTDSTTFLLYSDELLTTPVSGVGYGAYTGGGYVSGGGSGGGASYFGNLLDVPTSYVGSGERLLVVKADETGIEYTNNITASVTGSLIGNASTATRFETTRTINGVNFNGTADITFGTDAVAEGSTNQYYLDSRARDSVGVTPSKTLTYTSSTGVFDIAENVATSADTLVKRDADGKIHANTLYVDTLSVDNAVSLTVTNNVIGAFNLTTSGIVSATNFVSTGTGDPTIESAGKIVLAPTTYVDVSSKLISNLATPVGNTDATTKLYVDTAVTTVDTAAMKDLGFNADSGGAKTLQKGNVLTFIGGTNIATVSGTNTVTVNLDSTLSNISVSGALPVAGNITSTTGYVKGGNVKIDGDAVTQTVSGSNLNLVAGTGAAVALTGLFNINSGTLAITGTDTLTIAPNSSPRVIDLTTNVTFIRTLDWSDITADLAYATIAPGREGQIKTIIIETRGVYGQALDTQARYLKLSGNINGSSQTVNIGKTDPNGSSTFIFLGTNWWRISQVG